jgi:hypothetical protein
VRILGWQALAFVLGAIVVLSGAAVGHYVWSDNGTLKAQLAAARQQVAAAQQETATARQQTAAARQQAAVWRTQVTASRSQYAFVIARDNLDRLDRMRDALSPIAHKSGAKH